jgi:hypothetical protein
VLAAFLLDSSPDVGNIVLLYRSGVTSSSTNSSSSSSGHSSVEAATNGQNGSASKTVQDPHASPQVQTLSLLLYSKQYMYWLPSVSYKLCQHWLPRIHVEQPHSNSNWTWFIHCLSMARTLQHWFCTLNSSSNRVYTVRSRCGCKALAAAGHCWRRHSLTTYAWQQCT